MDDRLQRAPIGVLDVSADGTVSAINEIGRTLIDATSDPTGAPLADVFPRSVDDTLLIAFEGESVTEADFEEYYPDLERWLAVSVVSLDEGGTVYVRDVTERRRDNQSLQQLRQERKRTALIDDVLSEPAPTAPVTGLGDSAVVLQGRIWIDPSESGYGAVRARFVEAVKRRFDSEGIDMPYPNTELSGGIEITNPGEVQGISGD